MLTIHKAGTERDHRQRATIGLAIAGGGPVGAVYELGALRALDESIDGLGLHTLDVYVGVSAGAFIAASLANRISTRELCRIFIGEEHAKLKFIPEQFLRPAYREYLQRAGKIPGIVSGSLLKMIRHPLQTSIPEIIAELGRALPSGIFDNETIHRFMQSSFASAGVSNRFSDLDCRLYVVAVDLDSGAAVRFGSDESPQVPISRAVQASAALPGLYPPVRIGDRYYVDGALRRTLHASAALDQGVDLLIGINPLVPFDAGNKNSAPHIAASALVEGGLPLILSQTFRAIIQSRMKIGFEKYRSSHASADLLLLEPDRDDEMIFFTNIFSYTSRIAFCEHAYQTTRKVLRARSEELSELLEPHGMSLRLDRLDKPDRTLAESMGYRHLGHSSVGRGLASTLDELEDLLEQSG